MSLLKKQSSFEEKLKKQLDGTEMKPSDALWNRIEQNMYADSFEPALQEKLENYTVDPRKEVWDQVESQLPESRRKRGFIWFSSVAVLLMATFVAGYWFSQNGPLSQQELLSEAKTQVDKPAPISSPDAEMPAKNNLEQSESATDNKLEQAESPAESSTSVELNPNAQSNALVQSASKAASNSATKNSSSDKASPKANNTTLSPKAASSKPSKAARKNTKASSGSASAGNKSQANASAKSAGSPKSKSSNFRSEPIAPATAQLSANNALNPVAASNEAMPPQKTSSNSSATAAPASQQNSVPPANQDKPAPAANEPKLILESLTIKPAAKDSFEPNKPFHGSSYMAPEETFTQFSITAFAGIHMSMMQLSLPSETPYANLQKSLDLRNEMESPALDFSGGLLLNYHLGKRWMISSGIGITSFQQKVNFAVMPAIQSNPSLVQPQNMYVNPKDSIVQGTANSYENKYSFTEIPLYATYQFPSEGRVHFELMGGVSFGKLNLVNAYMPDPGCIGVLVVNDKASFPEFTNVFFATLSPNVSFKLNSSVDLGVMPNIKASLNSMVKNEQWIQQKPWLVGLGVYLRKRF